MAQLLDHIDYLSREIGPRPAGTEEEQESALYIADQFQRESGFRAEIEEFTSSANLEGAQAIPAVLIIVVVILAMLFNVLTIPALVITLVAVAVYASESFDRPFLSRALARGASQNVVAKYQPGKDSQEGARNAHSRKIVLVAHYDSGKVKPKMVKLLESTKLPLGYIALGGMAATILFLLVRIFVGSAGGVATVVLNILSGIALVAVALPVFKAIMVRVAPYNEGANNNASGVAALLEIAHRISEGSASEADLALVSEQVVMHGEEEALESGLVPEGAEFEYAASNPPVSFAEGEEENISEEERLLAAKAAIAALTGRPVESHVFTREAAPTAEGEQAVYENLPEPARFEHSVEALDTQAVRSDGPTLQPVEAEASSAPVELNRVAKMEAPKEPVLATVAQTSNAGGGSADAGGFQNAPSWFVAAQKNAKKPAGEVSRAQRSRYTQALDMAERERQREEAERQRRIAEQRQLEEAARLSREAASITASEPAQDANEDTSSPAPLHVSVPAVVNVPSIQEDHADGLHDEAGKSGQDDAPHADNHEATSNPAPSEVDLGKTVAHAPINTQDIRELTEADAQDDSPAPKKQGSLANLPDISEPNDTAEEAGPDGESAAPSEVTNPSRSGIFRKLRADIPSLSGSIRMQNESAAASPNGTSTGGGDMRSDGASPAHSGVPAVSAIEPVDYDMDVPELNELGPVSAGQADAHAGNSQPSPASTPGQVEMPSSRADGFLGRLRSSKSDSLDETPQEWLEINEDFDARTVGRERGSWESFREDAAYGDTGASSSASGKTRTWEGGAFSRVHLDHVDTRSADGSESGVLPELADSAVDRELNEEIGQIIHFRNPHYNTEVWFVAIGSDTELHDGAQAFVNAHRSELRGAMIIELESLGAGVLTCASEEGRLRKVKASSRAKRFTRLASEATGIVPEEASLMGADSITSTIQKAGFQAMHLFGMEDGGPALKGSADDVIENIDELTLEENVNFLLELLKNA